MQLYNEDCLSRLKLLGSNSVDSIVTDPPYGLGVVKDICGLLTAWMTDQAPDEHVGSAGFLNQAWDKSVPPPTVWKECFRVLKPGGYLLVFCGTRTQDLMGISIRIAGFELRDEISYLGNSLWVYGTGFPKGNMLKPAHEPILMFRKSPEGTLRGNREKWGTGQLNIDECRNAWPEGPPQIGTPGWGGPNKKLTATPNAIGKTVTRKPPAAGGRHPTNLILSHNEGCVLLGTKRVKTGVAKRSKGGNNFGTNIAKPSLPDMTYADPSGMESIPKYQCAEGCPVAIMGDKSRFFYCSKPSKKEKNKGLSTVTNDHPTVKPVEILRYLCRLVTPKTGTVLDPFMGSGSTGVAAAEEGLAFIGIEREQRYFEIAKDRLS